MNKKGIIKICVIISFMALILVSCAGGGTANIETSALSSGAVFKDVEGWKWELTEIVKAGETVVIDRDRLKDEGIGGFFKINFQESTVNGTGAPNSYFGPYTAGKNNALSIGPLASTLMVAFKEAEELKEHEYFTYLSAVTRWDLKNGKLELNDGAGTILRYGQSKE
jgi:heat shock protein HslJ